MIFLRRNGKKQQICQFLRYCSTEPVKLRYEKDNNIARITLNNPKVHNSISEDIIFQLQSRLDEVNKSSTVRCLILDSIGKNFSAGANLDYMKRLGGFSREENVNDAMKLSNLFETLHSMSIPTLCVAQGASFGGALGLIASCDVSVSLKTSKFCFSEVKLGIIPATISPFIVKRIGIAQSKRLFLTAEIFDSTVAKNIGLIHDDASTIEDLKALEDHYVSLFLFNGPKALKNVKELLKILDTENITSLEIREKTANLLADVRSSEEAKEGLTAFFEKRQPSYKES